MHVITYTEYVFLFHHHFKMVVKEVGLEEEEWTRNYVKLVLALEMG